MNCLRFAAKIYSVNESELKLLKPIGSTKRFIRLQSNDLSAGDTKPKYVNKCTIIQNKKTGVPPRPKSIYSPNNGVKSNGAAPVYEAIYNVPYSCHHNYDIYANTIKNNKPVYEKDKSIKRENNSNSAALRANESKVKQKPNRVSKRESDLLNDWRPRLNHKPPVFDKTISTDTTIYNVPLNHSKYRPNYSNMPRMSQIKTYQSRINRKVEQKPAPPVYMAPPPPPPPPSQQQQQQFYYYFSNINYSYFNAI